MFSGTDRNGLFCVKLKETVRFSKGWQSCFEGLLNLNYILNPIGIKIQYFFFYVRQCKGGDHKLVYFSRVVLSKCVQVKE